MREIDQRLLSRAMTAIRMGTPSCTWSAFADVIAAERASREAHLNKPAGEVDHTLAPGLEKLRTDGVVVHPLKMAKEKVAAIRSHLEGLPVYGGFHIHSSDRRQRPLAEARRETTLAGYTADQLLRTPHLVDFLNRPAIVDFLQLAIGCVPTLYSVNAWWSFPSNTPSGISNQYFHRDTDDWRFFTLFLYLTDVDENGGPHQLIAGSHTLPGMQRLIERAARAGARDMPLGAMESFRNSFGAEFSAACERLFGNSIVNMAGEAGTIFTANTVAIHRGLTPTKSPRLVVWARYGLGPNTNSIDLEQGPLAHAVVANDLPDTPRNRYVNRLLFEFDRGPQPVYAYPELDPKAGIPVKPAADTAGKSTTTLRLAMGELKIVHPIAVPPSPVPAAEVMPALQGLVDAVVEAAERKSRDAGLAVSCRKGCAACCRELVPVSQTEGERLLGVIEAMPAPRRAALAGRFTAAAAALAQAGLGDALLDAAKRAGKSERELAPAYRALGIACPFLEEESCAIHAERPLACREHLATSPARLCAMPALEGVKLVAVPKASVAARGLEEDRLDVDTSGRWFALALLPGWSKARPPNATRRPGPEWVQRFVKRLGT